MIRLDRRQAKAFLLGALLLWLPGPVAGEGDEARLVTESEAAAGVPVDGALEPGSAHAYALQLEADGFLDALVEQRGADVAVALEDPHGRVMLALDTNQDPFRCERVLWVAAEAGQHRLVVRSQARRPGGYRLTLKQPRPASAGDRSLAAAARAYEEGLRLAEEKQDTKREQGLARLEQAVAAFRVAGDLRAQAEALERVDIAQRSLSRHARALEAAGQALSLYEQVGDRAAAAWAQTQLGQAARALGDLAGARSRLEQAVRAAREMGNDWAEAVFLNNLADFLPLAGDAEQAIELFGRAVALSRQSGNSNTEAFALANLGVCYKNLGEYRKALASYEQALPLFVARADGGEARLYLNMGNVYVLLGEHRRALELYEHYLAYARKVGSADDEARGLNNMAGTHIALGEYVAALDESLQALELRRAAGQRALEGLTLRCVGYSLFKLGRGDEGAAALEQALAIHRELHDTQAQAETLGNLAEVERGRGALERALARIQESLGLTEALRSRLTSPELRASFAAVEQEKHELLVDLRMRLQERDPGGGHAAAALQASEAARARVLLEALVEARADVRQGIAPALLEQERALQKQLQQASDRLGRALAVKATDAQVASATAEFEELSGSHRLLLAGLRKSSPAYSALMQPSPLSAGEIQREVLDADTVLLEYALGAERSYLFALTSGELASYALPGRSEIEQGAREVYALLTERQGADRPAAQDLPKADERLSRKAGALSRTLLGPIAGRLQREWRGKRLAIVASGALAYIPFGALPEPSAGLDPLLVSHEIVTLPSASVLAALRRQFAGRALQNPKLAVLADPVFDPGDPRVARARRLGAAQAVSRPGSLLSLTRAAEGLGRTGFSRLPFSRQEAGAIAALAPPGSLTQAVDFEASRAWVESGRLAGHSIVHFATHGLLNSEHPDLSGLVLSLVDERAAWQDGFLRMADIYNLRLDAELVVLSACQTALGREVRGEGLIGVTRGFMYAGAPRVLASLWEVDDQSTAELMRVFYRALLRERRRPAEALRLAQLELSRQKRWAAPYYWAGFVLQGEWR